MNSFRFYSLIIVLISLILSLLTTANAQPPGEIDVLYDGSSITSGTTTPVSFGTISPGGSTTETFTIKMK